MVRPVGGLPGRERGGLTGPFVADQLERDGEFRDEVAAAVELGIPYSLFTGRIVGENEPLWLESDRAIVLAFIHRRGALCPGCGNPKHDVWSVHNPDYPGGRWEARAVKCQVCATASRAHQQFARPMGDGRPPDMAGMYFPVYPAGTFEDGKVTRG